MSALLLACGGVAPAAAQTATLRVEENVRAEPNGVVLGRLDPGTVLPVEGRRDRWLEVGLEGWVWIRSLQVIDRGGLDLVVSASEGENLRTEPRGIILGRLEAGTLLEEVERIPGWIQVRRRGWIWAPSVDVTEAAEPPEPPEERGAGAGDADAAAGSVLSGDDAGFEREVVTAPPGGAELLVAPDGDTLARLAGGAETEVLERQGSWVRIRLEGWAWVPDDSSPETTGGGGGPTLEDVRAEPERHHGRIVTWTLQFVSLERAERVRTDFFRGEPFLLTRSVDDEGAFVYVAVPPARLEQVADLTPLERVEVRGRIRTGASAFTGSPILDLLELRRVERRREGGRPEPGGGR